MKKHIFRLSLRTQLLSLMLSMVILSIGSVVYLQKITEEKMLSLIQKEINGLTEAIEISMEQITATGSTNEARLMDYFNQLRKRGMEEVSIINKEQEVIQSSNPRMIGSKISVSKNEFLITARIGDGESENPKKLYSAFVPVISEGKLRGYIHVNMYFDDLVQLNRDILYERVLWVLAVFGIGVLLCILISYRYTKPIPVLIDAIRSISQGNMPNLPHVIQADISGLADSLNEMIKKLEEQKTLTEKLKLAEHQALLAQLASGIAHEIRNPLNFINLSIDHLSAMKSGETGNSTGDLGDLIKKMKIEIHRINQMIANFLDLGRELVLHPISMPIDLPVEESIRLCSHLIQNKSISIERDFCNPVPTAEIDIDRMISCFQNLIANAIDAMPNGGKVKISIRENNGYANLTFQDTGEGIGTDNLLKIFEPYFTTKKAGIGLGLAIVKRIIEAHMGSIDIESSTGRGTSVRISIPR